MLRALVGVILLCNAVVAAAQSAGTIRWVMEDAAPFSYLEHERVRGFFPDIALAICQEINATCEFSVLPGSKAVDAVRDGEAEGVLGVTYVHNREGLRYSAPVVKSHYGIFTLAGPKEVIATRITDLKGLDWTVGTQGPSDTYNALRILDKDLSDLSIKSYPSYIEAIFAVNNKDINAVFGSLDVIRDLEKIAKIPPLHDVGYYQPVIYSYAWNTTTMSPKQAAAFNAGYQKLHKNGTIAEIAHHYKLTLAQ